MPYTTTRVCRPLAAALLLALAGSLHAYAPHTEKIFRPSIKNPPASESERAADNLRRRTVLENTQHIFALLGAEIAAARGQSQLALNTYLAVLQKTKDPEVAERAMELAVGIRAYDTAEHIYAQWRKLEPKPGPAQRRIAWTRALAFGDHDQVARDLENVVKEANEEQAQRIFLLLAQVGTENHALAAKVLKPLHRAAQRHPDMTEALIASALFDSIAGNTKQAVRDLQKLADNDTQLTPATRLALGLIVRDNPKLLPEFFKQTDTAKLSPIWQELEVESLIQDKQYDQAYERLQKLLANKNDADLYIQAAVLSYQHQKDLQTTLNHLEKAHQHGTQLQKSRAAVLAAIRLLADRRFDEAEKWIARIHAPETAFDKLVLQVSLAAEQHQWQQALQLAGKRGKPDSRQGRFFNEDDLIELELFALTEHHAPPKQKLAQLNRLINRFAPQPQHRSHLAATLYQRGIVYAEQNRYREAVADFRHYLRLKPEDAQGLNALGYTLLEAGNSHIEEAFELIKQAYRQQPESPEINDSIGWVYFKKGDPKTALPYLQYAYEKAPSAEVAAHLGEVYWAMGEHAKARDVWHESWQQNRNNRLLRQTLNKYGVRFSNTSSQSTSH
ncbi:tetratricopeptide repeat protein [Conchiformibius kuhniae]|uniref:Tetratricopeptide repeat protein n=1 Tax=Conchiformibius kuhniae TaxID=211502 RepID=A0A8T9MTF3_9NEIS|nr:tetratricopeptide repeat protein [Conchiformibius kuhniae]